MLNLLRYRARADYSATPHLAPPGPIDGATAYQLYIEHTLPILRRSGGDVVFLGRGGPLLIGPPGERWDAALLVRQASVAAFMAFASNPEYLRGHRSPDRGARGFAAASARRNRARLSGNPAAVSRRLPRRVGGGETIPASSLPGVPLTSRCSPAWPELGGASPAARGSRSRRTRRPGRHRDMPRSPPAPTRSAVLMSAPAASPRASSLPSLGCSAQRYWPPAAAVAPDRGRMPLDLRQHPGKHPDRLDRHRM